MLATIWKPTAHLLFYSFAFGGVTFYSYVAAPIAFKTLEKNQFSTLQNNVFPYFFQMQSVSPIILAMSAPFPLATGPAIALASASLSGLTNLFWLLPWTRTVKEKRRALAERLQGEELEKYDKSLREEFGRSHGLSLFFNLAHVCGMLAYGFFLTKGLTRYIPK